MKKILASLLLLCTAFCGGNLCAKDKSADMRMEKSHSSSSHDNSNQCKKGERWFAGWGRALQRAFTPQEYDLFGSPPFFGPIFRDGVTDRTVRIIAHMSVGGSKIRLTFQNQRFDPTTQTTSVYIQQVNVAKQDSAQSIVPGTNKLVTFNKGATSVEIFPGGSVVSDPINFDVATGDNLAVSLYFQQPSGPPPYCLEVIGGAPNYIPRILGYVALDAGNLNSNTTFTVDTTQAISADIWLSGVDVKQSSCGQTIACWGDSIILGTGSSAGYFSFSDQLADRLQSSKQGKKFGVINLGINGNKITDGSPIGSIFGAAALNRFPPDLLTQPSLKYVIFLEGLNDITSDRTAEQVIDGILQWVKLVKRARRDVKIYGGTVLPFQGQSGWTPAREAVREEVNNWIRNSSKFDAVIDFSTAIQDPNNPLRINPPWDSGDHYHPNDAGFGVMADTVDLKLFGVKK